MFQGESGWKPVQLRRGDRDEFRESSVAGKPDAGGEGHRAAIRRPVAAVVAHAAGDLGVDDRGFPRCPRRHPISDVLDDARDLVTWDGVGEQPHLVRGQIGAADPTPVDPDHNLPGNGLGDGELDALEVVRLDELDGLHGYMRPSCATMRSSSEMTEGSVWTSMTLHTPLSIDRSSAGSSSPRRSTRS